MKINKAYEILDKMFNERIFPTSEEVFALNRVLQEIQDKDDRNKKLDLEAQKYFDWAMDFIKVSKKNEDEKCEYCKLNKDNSYNWFYENDFGIRVCDTSMGIHFLTEHTSAQTEIKINYCPMCGRKLSE